LSKEKAINLIMPVFFVIFSIWIIVTAYQMGSEEGTFPLMVGGFQLIVALFQLYFDLTKSEHVNKFKNSNVWKVIEAVAVMSLYVFMLKKIGYVIDTTVLAIYTMVTLGYRRWGVVFISAVSITAVVFFVFKVLLNVPLPMLFFEF
jgi:putative tricarboxylic transport membrane protein